MGELTTTRQAALSVTTYEDDGFAPLTKYEPAPVRPDHLACISAGYMDAAKGHPVVSRDGVIYLSDPLGRAQGLAEALKANGGKSLTIALPSDRRPEFIHQHYRKEGKTRLEAFGDASGITVLDGDGGRKFYPAGTREFTKLVSECKVSTDITFFLAGWDKDEHGRPKPMVYFPDGLAPYRIRTSSPKTVNNLLGCIETLRKTFGGPIAGIPLEVRLVYPKVADPKGEKRSVPLFAFTFAPPVAMALDARRIRDIAAEAAGVLPSMALLSLPAAPTVDEALEEFEQDLLTVPLDADRARAKYFAIAGETRFAEKAGRVEFLEAYTNGEFGSLAEFLSASTPDQMALMLEALEAAVTDELPDGAGDHQVHQVHVELVDDGAPITPEQTKRIGDELKRLGWSKAQASAYCVKAFGKKTSGELTKLEADELLEDLAGMSVEKGEA